MKYYVEVKEYVKRIVEVEAEDEVDAIGQVNDAWINGQLELSEKNGDFTGTTFTKVDKPKYDPCYKLNNIN